MNDLPPEGTGSPPGDQKVTPAMQQYREMKAQYPDAILFFHIGDFYETFGTDAELVSRELGIVLTSRSKNHGNRIPLAGVPHHAGEGYIARLVGKGYKVAICEQVEDPKTAKGLVRREVVRVITPGTVIDSAMLPSPAATYLMALCPPGKKGDGGAAFLDISTGEFFVLAIPAENPRDRIRSEIARYHPAECILPPAPAGDAGDWVREQGVVVTPFRDEAFDPARAAPALCAQFGVASLVGYGCEGMPAAIGAAGAVLAYAQETQKAPLTHISRLATRVPSETMMLDAVTLRNLELVESIRNREHGATLYSTLDRTTTPMGARLLLRQLTAPLTDTGRIDARLDAVGFFFDHTALRLSLRDQLARFADIERITGRIAYGNAGPRDLVALADSLAAIPALRQLLFGEKAGAVPAGIREAGDDLAELPDAIGLIRKAIRDDPPPVARNGGVIRPGYSRELDELTGLQHAGRDWIATLQESEREKTGIRSLKVGYNRVFGYYIDVTKPNLPLVPSRYERRQTTATGERYTIPELREKESQITHADERALALERELYEGLLVHLRGSVAALQRIAAGVALLDVAASHAEVAQVHDYVRPQLDGGDAIVIRDGRHPVVETGLAGGFVPNDTELSGSGTRIMIITGANMAGKSTYMRAVALTCIMAQAGSFVPARHARIGILDRIFTRVGAFDDLASGQSTFFVEMLELANILNNVTPKSLVILDEIGRGTSTADGCSIAQAVLEYLHGRSAAGPTTLFATHFHELVAMEDTLKRAKNYHFAVRETPHEVVFLRRLIPGATDKSYGIHVARLAGIPGKVTDRAGAILAEHLSSAGTGDGRPRRYTQLLLADDRPVQERAAPDPVLAELENLDTDTMTPLGALAKIAELKQKLGRKKKEDDHGRQ